MLEKFKSKDSKGIIKEFNKIGSNVVNGEDFIRKKKVLDEIMKESNKETLVV